MLWPLKIFWKKIGVKIKAKIEKRKVVNSDGPDLEKFKGYPIATGGWNSSDD